MNFSDVNEMKHINNNSKSRAAWEVFLEINFGNKLLMKMMWIFFKSLNPANGNLIFVLWINLFSNCLPKINFVIGFKFLKQWTFILIKIRSYNVFRRKLWLVQFEDLKFRYTLQINKYNYECLHFIYIYIYIYI